MLRRTLLTGVTALAASVAGCGGSSDGSSDGSSGDGPAGERPNERPDEELLFPEYTFEEAEDGTTVVVLTVKNPGPAREVALTTKINGPDDEEIEETVDVSLDAQEQRTVRVHFDVPWSWFYENRNLRGVEYE